MMSFRAGRVSDGRAVADASGLDNSPFTLRTDMQNLTATIPHRLTRAEAKRRIDEQVAEIRRQHATLLAGLQTSWTQDTMDFSLQALGQTMTGQVNVDDQAVHVSVELPWLLRTIAGTFTRQLEQRVRHALSAPPSTEPK